MLNLAPRLYTWRSPLTGGKTLVKAGHVSPRIWEITKYYPQGWG